MQTNKTVNSSYVIKTIKNKNEIEEIRYIWENLQCHPNSDIDFYLTIIESMEEIIRPNILILYSNGIPISILIGRIEEKFFEFKIGYKVIKRTKIKALTIIYKGLIGQSSKDITDKLVSELLESLVTGEVDIIYLSHVDLNSTIYSIAKDKPKFLFSDHAVNPILHWQMNVPETVEMFLQKFKSKRRHEYRRYNNVLQKKYPDQVKFVLFKNIDDIEKVCEDVEKIAETTYQRGLQTGFIKNEINFNRLLICAKKGWLRAYILYIDNNPCAYWIGTLYDKTLYLDFTGFEPKYMKYQVGTVSYIKMVEEVCTENIQRIDFGWGDAFYKQRFGDKNWEEADVYIFATSLKGLFMNTNRVVSRKINVLFNSIITKYNLRNKVKKIWRKKLEPKK